MQGILWVLPIALFVYLEPIAFQGLEGSKPSHFAVSLVAPTVTISLSVLVINPAAELLIRSNARTSIKISLFIATLPLRRKLRKNVVRARKNARRVREARNTDLISSAELYSLEANAKSWEDGDKKRDTLARIARIREEVVARRKEMKELDQEVADTLGEAIKIRKEFKLGILTPEEMARMEIAVTQMDFRVTNAEIAVHKETLAGGHKN
jgi:hypothetical protein